MQWNNIFDLCKPFSEVPEANVDEEMMKHNYTVHKMFVLADQFYQSIGKSNWVYFLVVL